MRRRIMLWKMAGVRGQFREEGVLMLGYSALLSLGLLVSAPWWLTRMATTRRYREGLGERMGRVPGRLRAAVSGKRVVWVHAVSVGEVLAVSRLVVELETALANGEAHGGESWAVVVSTTTRTGQTLAQDRFGAERVFYFPLDFAFAVRAFLRVLRPSLAVLAESELWPRMLSECRREGIPVAVVNARVSDRSFRRALRVRAVWGRVLRKVTLLLAQSDEDARRLVALGASDEAVRVSGNLKYDVRAPKASRVAELIRGAAAGRRIVVAGSTVGGFRKTDISEDADVIRVWATELSERGVVLVLAPRHPENFSYVHSMAVEYPTLLASEMLADPQQLTGGSVQLGEGERRPVEIIVLDTIGDLAAVYELASAAFVGGSLIRKGGHNPLEPAQFGVPVVMGPSYENFRDVVAKMQAVGGILIVEDAEELGTTLRHLLDDPEATRRVGDAGKRVFDREQGATSRSVTALQGLLVSRTAIAPDRVVTA